MHRILLAFCVVFVTGCAAQRQLQNTYLVSMAPSACDREQTPPSPPANPAPKAQAPMVFLDPGHGGHDYGASSRSYGLREKALTLEIATSVGRILRRQGYEVGFSRTKDVYVSLPDRVQKAEARQASILVSIHLNSAPNPKGRGAEVYYYRSKGHRESRRTVESRCLAKQILDHLSRDVPIYCRGVKLGNFHVIRETTMPAVLVEAAFLTNPKDVLLLASMQCRQQVACAIAKGISDYLRLRKKP